MLHRIRCFLLAIVLILVGGCAGTTPLTLAASSSNLAADELTVAVNGLHRTLSNESVTAEKACAPDDLPCRRTAVDKVFAAHSGELTTLTRLGLLQGMIVNSLDTGRKCEAARDMACVDAAVKNGSELLSELRGLLATFQAQQAGSH